MQHYPCDQLALSIKKHGACKYSVLFIGFDDYLYRNGVCLIEWANQLREDMPEDAIWIEIEKDLSLGENYRKITITGGVEN